MRILRSSSLLLLLAALAAELSSAAVLKIKDPAHWREATAGKTVFVKFFAPWCGHCKALAPAWEQLAAEWEGHKVGLVAEVDCTDEASEDLCEDFDVDGYPTLLYGDPETPEPYEGGRDLESLSAFAKENIATAICSVSNQDVCTDEQKATIADLKTKTRKELEAIEDEVDDKQAEAYEVLEKGLEELNAKYQEMSAEYNAFVEKIKKEKNYKWVSALLAEFRKNDPKKDTDEEDDDDDDDEVKAGL